MTTTNSPPSTLLSERLELRVPIPADAPELFSSYTSSLQAAKFLQRQPHRDLQQTQSLIDQWGAASWRAFRRHAWLITHCESGETMGLFLLIDHPNYAEIHFGIAPRFWGYGYTTEAGRKVMNWLISSSHIQSVQTVCDCENRAAARVLDKLGFSRSRHMTAHLRLPHFGEDKRDCWLYTWERRPDRSV